MYVSFFSISVLMSSQTQRRSRSLSPVSTPRLDVPRWNRSLERTRHEEVFFDDEDDEWIFDPAIDAILNSHKRTRDEAFSDDDDDDNVSSYWDWLPPEIQVHITSLAWRQHMRDMRSNQPFFNFLLREIHDHHTLTTAVNEDLDENMRGRIIYRHNMNYGIVCPTIDICASRESRYDYGCRHLLSVLYFVTKCGEGWFLGYSFHEAHINLKYHKALIARHVCVSNCQQWRLPPYTPAFSNPVMSLCN